MPVAKVAKPTECTDFRPISVTPILSRLLEKTIVKNCLHPALVNSKCWHLLRDQIAFRPTGSTTSALISLIHKISNLLQKYPYAHVFSLDFSKAFDTLRRSILLHPILPTCLSSMRLTIGFWNFWMTEYIIPNFGELYRPRKGSMPALCRGLALIL